MTNGPESSSKVSTYTGIGPSMALPSVRKEDDEQDGKHDTKEDEQQEVQKENLVTSTEVKYKEQQT